MQARRKRVAWKIADHPNDPPDPSLHPDKLQLRCVALSRSAVAAWDKLRDDHFKGQGLELNGAFLHEASLCFFTLCCLPHACKLQPAVEPKEPDDDTASVPARLWQEFDIAKEEVQEVCIPHSTFLALTTIPNTYRLQLRRVMPSTALSLPSQFLTMWLWEQ
jgi:hypothetical protein